MIKAFLTLAAIVFIAIGLLMASLGMSVDNAAGSAIMVLSFLAGLTLIAAAVTGLADGRG